MHKLRLQYFLKNNWAVSKYTLHAMNNITKFSDCTKNITSSLVLNICMGHFLSVWHICSWFRHSLLLWNPKVHFRHHKIMSLDPTSRSHLNLFLEGLLHLMAWPSQWYLLLATRIKFCKYFLYLPHAKQAVINKHFCVLLFRLRFRMMYLCSTF